MNIKYMELKESNSLAVCVDDLKLLRRSEDNLENETKIVKTISKDINMTFGLEKCARIFLRKGKSPEEPKYRKHI